MSVFEQLKKDLQMTHDVQVWPDLASIISNLNASKEIKEQLRRMFDVEAKVDESDLAALWANKGQLYTRALRTNYARPLAWG